MVSGDFLVKIVEQKDPLIEGFKVFNKTQKFSFVKGDSSIASSCSSTGFLPVSACSILPLVVNRTTTTDQSSQVIKRFFLVGTQQYFRQTRKNCSLHLGALAHSHAVGRGHSESSSAYYHHKQLTVLLSRHSLSFDSFNDFFILHLLHPFTLYTKNVCLFYQKRKNLC